MLIALGATLTYLLLPSDGVTLGRVAQVLAAFTAFLSAVVIRSAIRRGVSWAGGAPLALAMFMLGVVDVVFLVMDVAGSRYAPRAGDTVFLLLLVPLVALAGNEFRAHFESPDRREIATDVILVTVAVTSILYVLLRPENATSITGLSHRGLGGARRARSSRSSRRSSCGCPRGCTRCSSCCSRRCGVGTVVFGWQWTHGTFDRHLSVDRPAPDALPDRCSHSWRRSCPDTRPARSCGCDPGAGLDPCSRAPPCSPRARPWRRWRSSTTSRSVTGLAVDRADHPPGAWRSPPGSWPTRSRARSAHTEVQAALAGKEMRAAGDRRRARARPRGERDAPRLRGAPAPGLRRGGRRDRRARRARHDRAGERGVRADGRRSIGRRSRDRRGPRSPRRSSGADARVRLAPRGRARRRSSAPRDSRCTSSRASPRSPASPPRTLVLIRDVTAGARRRPDDPVALPVPAGSRRGPHAGCCAGRTPRSSRNATGSRATSTTGRSRACRAASLSLEAALLMIKAGDIDRGARGAHEDPRGARREADALRRLMSGLRPPVLEERGLIPALRETLTRFGDGAGRATPSSAGRVARPDCPTTSRRSPTGSCRRR